ncbi:S-4TM family putative pore-forming effector [Streptomyces solincola]|uniref:S-4TM family putative pore-forming effector n=1 Tax=Streptomyces solincola TaxID=2100817 RepID=UPI0015E2F7BD|nr:S-4TM family putative pore-forming effector [Streptomyces solincola]
MQEQEQAAAPGAVVPGQAQAPARARDIPSRQNDPDMITLLRAAHGRHRQAQHFRDGAPGRVRPAGVRGHPGRPGAGRGTPISLVGLGWALVYGLWAGEWAKSAFRRAAVTQELFDTQLFGLPWNAAIAGEPPEPHEVNRLARRYRGDEAKLRDYYEIDALPQPLDVLACQLQNLAWGTRVRRRYGAAVQWGLVLWCLAGVVVGVTTTMSVSAVLTSWFVPSLGLLLLGVDTFRAQRDTVAARERAQRELSARIDAYVADGSRPQRHLELLALSRRMVDDLVRWLGASPGGRDNAVRGSLPTAVRLLTGPDGAGSRLAINHQRELAVRVDQWLTARPRDTRGTETARRVVALLERTDRADPFGRGVEVPADVQGRLRAAAAS